MSGNHNTYSGSLSPEKSSSKLPFVALAFLALIWGYNWVAMKVGVHYSEPFLFGALRVFLGAAVLFPIMVVMHKPLRMPAPLYTIPIGLLQTSGFVGLSLWALASGSAGRTSVLVYTMPFWVLLLAWPLLGEKLHGGQWVAVSLALVGLILILGPWHLGGALFSSILALAAGFLWGLSAVIVKVMQRHYTVDLLSFTAWQMLVGSVPLIIVAALVYQEPPVWSGAFIAALIFNVIPASAVAWVLWLYALRSLPAGTAGINSLAIPVVGVLSAWIQLGEQPTALEAIGMLCVIGALALLTARDVLASRRSSRL